MMVFADTSALFALLVDDDIMFGQAKANFEYFLENNARLLTSSYVLFDTKLQSKNNLSSCSLWSEPTQAGSLCHHLSAHWYENRERKKGRKSRRRRRGALG